MGKGRPLDFDLASKAPTLSEQLDAMRKSKEMCDAVIVSSDGVRHDVHSVVMSAASHVFKTMLSRDGSFIENQSKKIEIPDLDQYIIEDMISFIYTGHVNFDTDNVVEIFTVADRFVLPALLQECINVISNNLDLHNCLGVYRLGDRFAQKDIKDYGLKCILQNFAKFSKTEEFSSVTFKELKMFLSHDGLNIDNEDHLIKIVVRWCDYKCGREDHMAELLKCLRYSLMNFEKLEILFTSDVRFKSNKKVFNFTQEVLSVFRTIYPKKKLKKGSRCFTSTEMECFSKSHRLPNHVLLVIGGWNRGHTLDDVECFNRNKGTWSMVNQFKDPQGGRCYFAVCQLNSNVLLLGGYDGRIYLNSVRRFNPSSGKWSDVAGMKIRRCFTTAVNFKGQVYIIAGFDGTRRLTSVERYIPQRNEWELVRSINTPRSDAVSLVHNEKLYLFGGFGGDSLTSCELFDEQNSAWVCTAPMKSKRSGACAVSLLPESDRIMVIGGYDGEIRLKSTEFYCDDHWSYGPSMFLERSNFGAVKIGGSVYVMGGYTGRRTVHEVERYDIKENCWYEMPDLNYPRSALKSVLIGNLRNASDYFSRTEDAVGRTPSSDRALQEEYNREHQHMVNRLE